MAVLVAELRFVLHKKEGWPKLVDTEKLSVFPSRVMEKVKTARSSIETFPQDPGNVKVQNAQG